MNILVVGASGFIGGYLYRYGLINNKVIGTSCLNKQEHLLRLDIINKIAVKELIKNFKPTVIIVPAAITNVDYCEKNRQETHEINVSGVENIVSAMKYQSNDSKLVYISTNYVFNGKKGFYVETDDTYPINEYGKQKLLAEKYIRENLEDYIIVRTCEVYGCEEAGKNFVVRLINDNKLGKTRNIPFDQKGNPTYVKSIVDIIYDLIQHDAKGIFHVAGSDIYDRFSFANMIAEEFDLDKLLFKKVSSSELNYFAPRPLNASLNLDKLYNKLNIKPIGVREGLKMMKREFFNK